MGATQRRRLTVKVQHSKICMNRVPTAPMQQSLAAKVLEQQARLLLIYCRFAES